MDDKEALDDIAAILRGIGADDSSDVQVDDIADIVLSTGRSIEGFGKERTI